MRWRASVILVMNISALRSISDDARAIYTARVRYMTVNVRVGGNCW